MSNTIDQIILSTFVSGLRSLLVLFLSVGFLGIGMLKVVNMPEIRDYFDIWDLPTWSMYLIGFIEVVLSVGIFYLPTRSKSLIGVAIIMIGASGVHLMNGEHAYLVGPALILMSALILFLIEQNQPAK